MANETHNCTIYINDLSEASCGKRRAQPGVAWRDLPASRLGLHAGAMHLAKTRSERLSTKRFCFPTGLGSLAILSRQDNDNRVEDARRLRCLKKAERDELFVFGSQ